MGLGFSAQSPWQRQIILPVVLTFLLALTACGGSTSTATSTTAPAASVAATAAAGSARASGVASSVSGTSTGTGAVGSATIGTSVSGTASVGSAMASTATTFIAALSGTDEVPARPASPATGVARFQVSSDGMSIQYTLTVQNITNVAMAHIHIGAKGLNGPVVVPLYSGQPNAGPFSGMLMQGNITAANLTGPLQGKAMADLLSAMRSGNAYVNVHTNDGSGTADKGVGDFPNGEIRGQVMAGPGGTTGTATNGTITTGTGTAKP